MDMFGNKAQIDWVRSIEERLSKLESAPDKDKYKGNLDSLPKYAYYGEVRALEIKWSSTDLYGKIWLHFNEPLFDKSTSHLSVNVSREWFSSKAPKKGDYLIFDENGRYHLLSKEEFNSTYFPV